MKRGSRAATATTEILLKVILLIIIVPCAILSTDVTPNICSWGEKKMMNSSLVNWWRGQSLKWKKLLRLISIFCFCKALYCFQWLILHLRSLKLFIYFFFFTSHHVHVSRMLLHVTFSCEYTDSRLLYHCFPLMHCWKASSGKWSSEKLTLCSQFIVKNTIKQQYYYLLPVYYL